MLCGASCLESWIHVGGGQVAGGTITGRRNQTHRPRSYSPAPALPASHLPSRLNALCRPFHPTNKASRPFGLTVQQPAWSNSSLLASYSGFSQRLRVQVPSSVYIFFVFFFPLSFCSLFYFILLLLFTPLLFIFLGILVLIFVPIPKSPSTPPFTGGSEAS
ncbi:hypothetical protein LY76DRAFT_72635 [Colletotrichum caudatum]|nr:hypothetical protein LY76DRAFT_72635 [Colletotrichum caudatum]